MTFNLAGDDFGLGVFEGRLDVVGDQCLVVLVEGVADTFFGEAEILGAGLPGALHRALESRVDRDIDPLQHRGEHAAGMEVVLVAVDADRVFAAVRRRLQHAEPGAACRGVDDVGAPVELALGEFRALGRIVPGRGRGAGHVDEHLGVGVRRISRPARSHGRNCGSAGCPCRRRSRPCRSRI